jgi:CRISPR-associated protein Cmr2
MTAHLLVLSLGPVQGFIQQARRTRDLWFGSHVLSELGRAAAHALAERGAALVFPALERGNRELEPCDGLRRDDDTVPLAVGNKIVARVPEGVDPAALARVARDAAGMRWRGLAELVRRKCDALLAPSIDALWHEQLDTFLEIAATWVPMEDGPGGFATARRAGDAELAGRKLLREFAPWRARRAGAPKSSFDGGRESVIAERPPERLARRYRLTAGEQLDAVGLVKRAGGDPEQFVPLTNVALAAWIQRAAAVASDELGQLARACADAELPRIRRDDLDWLRAFPYDAQWFLEDRWRSLAVEAGLEDGIAWARRHVAPVIRAVKVAPHPYVACLVADGDRMGERLDASDWDGARRLSRQLGAVAGAARAVVEQEYRGLLVYAGGDDVLAFVCLADAVPCAAALRARFESVVRPALPSGSPDPTLSVGLGVGHLLETLGYLLQLGQEAERLAKGDALPAEERRNALGVVVDKRAGGQVRWRGRWTGAERPADRLRRDTELLADRLSSKKVYEVRRLLDALPRPEKVDRADQAAWAGVLEGEVRRVLGRTYAGEGLDLAEAGLALEAGREYAANRRRVGDWVQRLLVSRMLVDATATGAREVP